VSTSAKKWSRKIAAWRRSGLSLPAWCRQNSESYQRALYWRKHLQQPDHSGTGGFVELSVPAALITLECNGILVHIAHGFDPALLTDVLSVLKRG
jgi:hypothetical protein